LLGHFLFAQPIVDAAHDIEDGHLLIKPDDQGFEFCANAVPD
jgi:hypothetical protein